MAYSIKPRDSREPIKSHIIARIIGDRLPDHPDTMRHLAAIERLEARGVTYANEDLDVLGAALNHARRACVDQPLDPPGYALRVACLESLGMTTSDAQGGADMEFGLLK